MNQKDKLAAHRLDDLKYVDEENSIFIVKEQLYPETRGWIHYEFRNKENALEFIKTGDLSLILCRS